MYKTIIISSVLATTLIACNVKPDAESNTRLNTNLQTQQSNLQESLKRKARLAYKQGRYQKSINILQQQLSNLQKQHQKTVPELGSIYFNLGLSSLKKGDNQSAQSYFKLGLPLAESSFGKNHLLIARYNSNLGTAYLRQNKYRAAIKPFQVSVNIKKNLYGESNHYLISDYARLKKVYTNLQSGKSDKIATYYMTKLAELKKKYSSRFKNLSLTDNQEAPQNKN